MTSARALFAGLLAAASLAGGGCKPPGSSSQATPPAASAPAPQPDPDSRTVTRNGLIVEFGIGVAGAPAGTGPRLMEGDWAEVRFQVKDEATGQPVRGLKPAAWMDMAQVLEGKGGEQKDCRERVALYLKGVVGMRPLVDLNAYYLLVMNQSPSISVIDPVVSMTGSTSLYAQVFLKRPGEDWVKSRTGRRLFVSMPLADEVAAIDTESFRLAGSIPAGARPFRTAMQPDGRYLWVGNDAPALDESGVTVIDTEKLEQVKFIATGRGHHEIAFSGDDRWAFVTNRDDGSVSVIDVRKLRKAKDLRTGSVPISIATSPLSGSIYVADGREGTVAVIDPERLEVSARIPLKPGLGPLRVSPDGRWAFVVNTAENAVHVVDTTVNRAIHSIPVPGKPYQVTFTRGFAYVRLLDSERVQMINLALVGEGKGPGVQSFVAGNVAPKQAGSIAIADSIAPANLEAAVFVNNPADGFTYYYMEGMNAPMGSFSGYGQRTRAVTVVDRSVKEVEPGVYLSRVRLPAAGRYEVAFLLDSPRLLHCFTAEAAENPALHVGERPLRVEFLEPPVEAPAGSRVSVRFKLVETRTGKTLAKVGDAAVLSFRAPGFDREQTPARETERGVYQAQLTLPAAGTYYLYVGAPSQGLKPEEASFRTIRATAAAAPSPGKDRSHAATRNP